MSRLKELRKMRGYTQIKMQMLTGIQKLKTEKGITHLNSAKKSQLRLIQVWIILPV